MPKGVRLPLEALEPYLLPTPVTEALDWQKIFGNAHPVELEVGFGKGLYLVNAAAAHPEVNYFGIEIVRKYQLLAATRLAKRELRNVRVACTDARPFLRDWVPSASLQRIHVYFPDPWWKKRHHKRRLFTGEFAATCQRLLMPTGELLVVTDVADYATLVRQTVAASTQLSEAEPPPEHTPSHDLDYLTHFERKFRQEGRTIHRLRFVNSPSPGTTKSLL